MYLMQSWLAIDANRIKIKSYTAILWLPKTNLHGCLGKLGLTEKGILTNYYDYLCRSISDIFQI